MLSSEGLLSQAGSLITLFYTYNIKQMREASHKEEFNIRPFPDINKAILPGAQ